MFKNLFRKVDKEQKSIYLAGWEVRLNGDAQCDNFITIQATTKETLEHIYHGIELVFENDKLSKAYDYREGVKTPRQLRPDEANLKFRQVEQKKILEIVTVENGTHQLGGELPSEFKMPENNCVTSFQYLGYVDNRDLQFQWLPFKLHLTCPIYLNFEQVFLDYSDPLRPSIINREEVEGYDTAYSDDLSPESEIVVSQQKQFWSNTGKHNGSAYRASVKANKQIKEGR
jgi:hypothetical protein